MQPPDLPGGRATVAWPQARLQSDTLHAVLLTAASKCNEIMGTQSGSRLVQRTLEYLRKEN